MSVMGACKKRGEDFYGTVSDYGGGFGVGQQGKAYIDNGCARSTERARLEKPKARFGPNNKSGLWAKSTRPAEKPEIRTAKKSAGPQWRRPQEGWHGS
jgi:hypothetical protein